MAPLALVLALWVAPQAVDPGEVERAWAALVTDLVAEDGAVRYGLLSGSRQGEFDGLLARLAAFDPAALRTDQERTAFWINAYNALFAERVRAAGVPPHVEQYGFVHFFRTPVRVAGRDLTLDEIEHTILRRQPGSPVAEPLAVRRLDPRIHVGLYCGAVSCPRLRAFSAATLDADLDAAMRTFVNAEEHFRQRHGGWAVSALLDWFAEDWDVTGVPAGDFLLRYLDVGRPGAASLRALLAGRSAGEIVAAPGVQTAYDWTLHAAR